jgi:hypothetical protein
LGLKLVSDCDDSILHEIFTEQKRVYRKGNIWVAEEKRSQNIHLKKEKRKTKNQKKEEARY